jgi:hypothetical protein
MAQGGPRQGGGGPTDGFTEVVEAAMRAHGRRGYGSSMRLARLRGHRGCRASARSSRLRVEREVGAATR